MFLCRKLLHKQQKQTSYLSYCQKYITYRNITINMRFTRTIMIIYFALILISVLTEDNEVFMTITSFAENFIAGIANESFVMICNISAYECGITVLFAVLRIVSPISYASIKDSFPTLKREIIVGELIAMLMYNKLTIFIVFTQIGPTLKTVQNLMK